MKGKLHQTNYGWIVRYDTVEGTKCHTQLYPEDEKYLLDSDNGKEVDFYTIFYTDKTHRPGKEKTVMYAVLSHDDRNEAIAVNTATERIMTDAEFIFQRLDEVEKKIEENTRRADKMIQYLVDKTKAKKATGTTREDFDGLSEIDIMYNMLNQARKAGLEPEVVTFALMSMRRDSSQTILDAMQSGLDEWIK